LAQPDVLLVDRDGVRCTAKDFSKRSLLVRLAFGRRVLRHEFDMLRELEDVDGAPRALCLASKDVLLMEHVEGPGPLPDNRETPADEFPALEFFTEFKSVLTAMHCRGIAHGDVRRRNVLRTTDGRPCLVDFATAVLWRGGGNPLRRALFTMFRTADDAAVLKLQRSYYPDSLSAEELRRLDRPPWYLAAGRFLRKRVYRSVIKQRTWQRRLAALRSWLPKPRV